MREKPARLFRCARSGCRAEVLICSHCDRGNRYCADGCANTARRALQRDAGERYQNSYGGRTKHAGRTRCWRQRKARAEQSVTHQGSQLGRLDAVLVATPPTVPATAVTATSSPCISPPCIDGASATQSAATPMDPATPHCHWCDRGCKPRVRLGFLRHSPSHGQQPLNFARRSCAFIKLSTGVWAPSHVNFTCTATPYAKCSRSRASCAPN